MFTIFNLNEMEVLASVVVGWYNLARDVNLKAPNMHVYWYADASFCYLVTLHPRPGAFRTCIRMRKLRGFGD